MNMRIKIERHTTIQNRYLTWKRIASSHFSAQNCSHLEKVVSWPRLLMDSISTKIINVSISTFGNRFKKRFNHMIHLLIDMFTWLTKTATSLFDWRHINDIHVNGFWNVNIAICGPDTCTQSRNYSRFTIEKVGTLSKISTTSHGASIWYKLTAYIFFVSYLLCCLFFIVWLKKSNGITILNQYLNPVLHSIFYHHHSFRA